MMIYELVWTEKLLLIITILVAVVGSFGMGVNWGFGIRDRRAAKLFEKFEVTTLGETFQAWRRR